MSDRGNSSYTLRNTAQRQNRHTVPRVSTRSRLPRGRRARNIPIINLDADLDDSIMEGQNNIPAIPPAIADVLDADLLQQLQAHIAERINAAIPPVIPPPNPPPQPPANQPGNAHANPNPIVRVAKINPNVPIPTYHPYKMTASYYLLEVEKYFTNQGYPQAQFLYMVTTILAPDAKAWCEHIKTDDLTWVEFKARFEAKYDSWQDKQNRIAHITKKRQRNNEAVETFIWEMMRLSKQVYPNETEENAVKRCRQGLVPRLRIAIGELGVWTAERLIERCLIVLSDLRDQDRADGVKSNLPPAHSFENSNGNLSSNGNQFNGNSDKNSLTNYGNHNGYYNGLQTQVYNAQRGHNNNSNYGYNTRGRGSFSQPTNSHHQYNNYANRGNHHQPQTNRPNSYQSPPNHSPLGSNGQQQQHQVQRGNQTQSRGNGQISRGRGAPYAANCYLCHQPGHRAANCPKSPGTFFAEHPEGYDQNKSEETEPHPYNPATFEAHYSNQNNPEQFLNNPDDQFNQDLNNQGGL